MVKTVSKKLQVVCLLLISISVIACSGLTRSDKPVTRVWWLNPYEGVTQSDDTDTLSPVELTLSVVPGLDTDQVLALSDNRELRPYSGARWADDLPELVTSLTNRSLRASARFKPVSGFSSNNVKPCNLQLELREFFGLMNSEGLTTRVQVAVNGHYQCGTEPAVEIQIKTTEPVGDNHMKTIVAAFQQAMDDVMKNLLSQLP